MALEKFESRFDIRQLTVHISSKLISINDFEAMASFKEKLLREI